ncbi:PEP-CTERM sorting domain-containing protein [Cerasicoccus frondis]|uniref:PEP-CTERM sorting domain-containing protein n=1 Tax=Cerasicoccus frondis TaxID=490090 RepID=UPI002852C8C9|nr:PEP-CTERM sorting domain-containing protein [Cerasicoccus frondis]
MKIYLSILSLGALAASQSHGVLLAYEPFDDAAGTQVPTGWSGTGRSDTTVTSGSLTAVSGLADSQGNKFSVLDEGGTNTYGLPFTPTGNSTGATIYYSFLFELTDISALPTDVANGPLFTLSDTTSKKAAAFSVALDADNANAFNIGLDGSNKGIGSASTMVDTTEYLPNTTLFIVVSYKPNGGGAGVANLWVNPDSSTFGTDTPPTVTLSDTGGYLADAQYLLFDKEYSATQPLNVDEIRVGTSWADVTPTSVPEPGHYAMMLGAATLGLLWLRRRR